jgi:hypothetical protein
MKNLKDSISIYTCTLHSKVPSAIYIDVEREIVCLEEDFQESKTYCKTHILNNILDLKQLKIDVLHY